MECKGITLDRVCCKKLLNFKVKLFPGIFFQKDLMVLYLGGGGGDPYSRKKIYP